ARYARGALRRHVVPAIAAHWPGYRHTLSRFARLAAQSAMLLQEVAESDLATLILAHPAYGDTLDLKAWRALSPTRRPLVLRAWLARLDLAMPSEARLQQMCDQLLRAAPDRQILLRHGEVQLRSYRDRIMLERRRESARTEPVEAALPVEAPIELQWQGESQRYLPDLGGTLCFEAAPQGFDPAWLKARPLRIGLRRGRERLPLVGRGSTLIYVAGLGPDARAPTATPGITLSWRADSPGATHAEDRGKKQ